MLRRLAIASLGATTLLFLNVAVGAAGSVRLPDVRVPVDKATCHNLSEGLKTQPTFSQLRPEWQFYVKNQMRDDGCYTLIRRGDVALPDFPGMVSAQASTHCKNWYDDDSTVNGPVPIFTIHLHYGVCWDGSRAWDQWHDCHVTTWPAYGSDLLWCGTYHNNTATMEEGMNFDIFVWLTWWWKQYGFIRDDVNQFGSEWRNMTCYPC